MKKSITARTLNNNINMKISKISIIKIHIISKHYFFLIKQDQQFIYNFYSWKLIIKQQDILINRIIGFIPNWIIILNQEITEYRIAHPWKYRGIKFSIFTLMKLIGLGFLLPYYGVVKGIYYFSKLRSLLSGEFTWKKVLFLVSAGVSGVLLYNNFFCIIAQCSEEKFDIIKSQSNLASTSKKILKSKDFWCSLNKVEPSPNEVEFWKIWDRHSKSRVLFKEPPKSVTETELILTQADLDYVKEIELNSAKTELNSVKAELIFVKAENGMIKIENSMVKTELNSVKTELNSVKTELNSVKTELSYSNVTKMTLPKDMKLNYESKYSLYTKADEKYNIEGISEEKLKEAKEKELEKTWAVRRKLSYLYDEKRKRILRIYEDQMIASLEKAKSEKLKAGFTSDEHTQIIEDCAKARTQVMTAASNERIRITKSWWY